MGIITFDCLGVFGDVALWLPTNAAKGPIYMHHDFQAWLGTGIW